MKFTCERSALTEAFSLAASVAPTRSPKEILQNVKVFADGDSLVFTATDMEVAITTRLSSGVSIEQPGAILLPVGRTSAILKESNDENITISLEDSGIISIKGTRSKFGLPSANPDEFPSVNPFSATEWIEIEADEFVKGFNRTSYAIDHESSRYALGGVKIEEDGEGIVFVGTDGRRLATQTVNASPMGHSIGPSLLIPAKAVPMLVRSIGRSSEPVKVRDSANEVSIESGGTTITARLVEGRYPQWRKVTPEDVDSYATATVSVGILQTAVRQAAIVTDNESRGIIMTFAGSSLTIEASTADIGDSKIELEVVYGGPEIKLVLDHKYVHDVCKVLNAESDLTLRLKSGSAPMVMSDDNGYQVILMPMSR